MSEPPAQSPRERPAAPHDAYAALLTQELRLPVAAILGLTRLLEEHTSGQDARVLQQYLALLGARAQHVARVADELTAFSELILGQPSTEGASAVASLAALVWELAGQRPVQVTISPAAAEPAVDPDRLRLVLQVLLDGAFALSAPGADVRLMADVVNVAGAPPHLVVKVTCSGDLLPSEVREALLGPLREGPREGPRGGDRGPSGPGLALLVGRSAAVGAGGALLLEQDLPPTFRLELPVRDDPISRTARELRERAALADAQALRAIQDMRTAREASIRERRAREAAVRRGARLQALHGAALTLAGPIPTEPEAIVGLVSGIVSGAVAAVGGAGGKLVLPDDKPWDALAQRDAPPVALAAPAAGHAGRERRTRREYLVVRHTGQLGRERLRPAGDAAHVFRSGEPVFVSDVFAPSRFGPFPGAVQRGVGSFAVLPLPTGGGTLGVLVVDFAAPRELPDEDHEVLVLFASHAAAALERVRMAHTERQLAGQTEQTAKREAEATALRELDRLKSELLAMISHELRTPLTVVRGYSQKLQEVAADADPTWIAQAAARIHDRAMDLSRLVEDVTEFSYLQRGEVPLHIRTFDLVPVLRDTVAGFRDQRGGERITGRWPAHLPAHADRTRVRQALDHLVENALRYAPESPVVVRARLTSQRGSNGSTGGKGRAARVARVEVEDRGPGITPAEQQRIWETLYRGTGVAGLNVARGSGIGLAVVKALVEAQGGRVGLESRPGFGSRFWFELPTSGSAGPAEDASASVPASTPPDA